MVDRMTKNGKESFKSDGMLDRIVSRVEKKDPTIEFDVVSEAGPEVTRRILFYNIRTPTNLRLSCGDKALASLRTSYVNTPNEAAETKRASQIKSTKFVVQSKADGDFSTS